MKFQVLILILSLSLSTVWAAVATVSRFQKGQYSANQMTPIATKKATSYIVCASQCSADSACDMFELDLVAQTCKIGTFDTGATPGTPLVEMYKKDP